MEPADPDSDEFLRNARMKMNDEHQFVEKTSKYTPYTFNLYGVAKLEKSKGKEERDKKATYQLTFYDQPGEHFEIMPTNPLREALSSTNSAAERVPDAAAAGQPAQVEQRSGADRRFDEPAQKLADAAFTKLMECDAFMIIIDPGWQAESKHKTSYYRLLDDLLRSIRNHHERYSKPTKPIIALAVSKIDVGMLAGAGDRPDREMWNNRDGQPEPSVCYRAPAASTDDLNAARFGKCEEKETGCLIFHALGEQFFSNSLPQYLRLDWQIGCFIFSAIGRLGESARVTPNGNWRRDLTPSPPTAHKASKGKQELEMDSPGVESADRAFYQSELVPTDKSFEAHQLFAPIEWLYQQRNPESASATPAEAAKTQKP